MLSNAQWLFTFTFTIRDRTNSVEAMEWQYLPHILHDQMLVSAAQDLKIIRHYPQSSLLTLFML